MKLGIDLGGTKIEIIALDNAGNTLHRQRTATPKNNYKEILESISSLVESTEAKLQQTGTLGICTPGAISPAGSPNSGLLRNSNSVCLNGKPFKQDLEKSLDREVAIANDANCFALSEAVDGAAKGSKVVFGVIVGTGTGAGIVIDGKVLTGTNAIAGEWGHNPLPWPNDDERPGLPCYCGKHGCIETLLSGTGLAQNFKLLHQKSLTAEQIVKGVEQGDEECEQAMQTYEDQMARGLSHVINILDPDVIVLGGGMSNIKRLYTNVPRLWHKHVFSDHVSTKLVPPVHGDSSGVRGAAWLTD
jgi:fructokinase